MWRPTNPADPAARAARVVTIAATMVFALIVCRFQPWQLFIRETYSNDFYDEQARSFLRLRLAVRPEIPGPEGFLVDGQTYLYYGAFLALVRLPFALFGEVFFGRLARVSMILGFAAYCTACFHLVRHLSHVAGRTLSRWRGAGFVAAAACSPVLFLSGWVSVYHETELWAATFAVWAIVGTLGLLEHRSPTRRRYLAAAFPIVAGILTRASVGIGIAAGASLAVLIVFWSRRAATTAEDRDQNAAGRVEPPARLRIWSRNAAATAEDRDQNAARRAIGAVVGASALGCAIHAAINWGRFGSPTALPGQLQVLSLNDPTRAAWFAGNNDSFFSLRFLSTNVVQYLRPDTVRLERLFPFVRYGPLATERSSYPFETITPAASLTASATLLLAAGLIGFVLVVRRRAWAVLAVILGGAIAAGPTFTIGFIANRYLVDMIPLILVPAAFAFATLTIPVREWRRGIRLATIALVAWGSWCNVSLALWTQQLKEPGFTEWRYRVDGWVFSDPAPGLTDFVPGIAVPRDGTVVLDRDPATDRCSGVYIAEQGTWVALEQSNDGRRLVGTVEFAGELTGELTGDRILIAGGDNWTVEAITADGNVRFEAEVDDIVSASEAFALPDDLSIAFDLVADPIVGQLSLTVDGEQALFAFAAPLGVGLAGADITLDSDPGDSLCRQLEARR